jgi:hypothetical protein
MNHKGIMKKAVAFALTASMIGTGQVANAASIVGNQKVEAKEAEQAQEKALKKAIRESSDLAEKYPNGLFNFLGTQFEINEGDDYLEICVMRQGGTQGEASVRLKAIDVTSSYGDDYKIYTSKKKNSPIEKGEDAFPLIETAYTTQLNLSEGETTAEDIVSSAAESYAESASVTEGEENPLDQYSDAEEPTAVNEVSTANLSSDTKETGISLKSIKAAYTGEASDREDWKVVADSDESEQVRENFDLFFDSVGGTETTLTFEDGEYVKYLYLFPEDDDVAEAEEQLVLALLADDDSAPVGDTYNSYVNIVDNEEVEESEYQFESTDIVAGEETAEVTIHRTKGTGYYDTIYVGTSAGTAVTDVDYTAGLQEVDFYAGQTEQTVSVNILENEYRDESRDFNILLSYDGEDFLDETCHVTIPGNSVGLLSTMAAESSTAEKISANGFRPSGTKGQWGVSASDLKLSGNGLSVYSNKTDMRYQHTGGNGTASTSDVLLYGVSSLEFGYWNQGSGRSWETWDYYYKNWWDRIRNKKTWYSTSHNEKNYGMNFYVGTTKKWTSTGAVNWAVGTAALGAGDWKQGFYFQSWAESGNATYAATGWVRLYLKQFSYQCQASQNKFYTTTYEPSINGSNTKLTKQSQKDITPTLSLASISSNVGNSTSSPSSSTKLYRSDALTFKLNNYNSTYLTFKGIEASADNKTWTKVSDVSDNYKVVLNADFFKKFNLYSNNTIYFRPVFTQNTATVKFVLDSETKTYNRGTYTNVAENSTVTLNMGDTIQNIQGKSGNAASYQPVFYLNTTKGKNAFTEAASNKALKLDANNKTGAVAILTASSSYNEVKLAYTNPTVTVQADPNTYRNTYTNLKYTIGSKTYDCSKTADVEALHTLMEKYYKNGTDATVTISFEYLANPEYKNGKGNQSSEFGTPKYAILNVYTDDGESVEGAPYKLEPTTTTKSGKTVYTFTKTGSWKSLGWVDGTSASIIFYGSKQVGGYTITSQETEIEFLNTSSDSVMVMSGSDILKDTSGNTIGNLSLKLAFTTLNPLSSYKLVGTPSSSFITRWADYSLDTDNDGNASIDEKNAAIQRLKDLGQDEDLVKGFTVYYGNTFNYTASTYAQSKIYYDFVKRDTSTGTGNVVGVRLTKQYSTVLKPDVTYEEPLTDAKVTFAGTTTVSGDEDGCYADMGNYEKGKTYLADVTYENENFQVAVMGATYQDADPINVSEKMFPTDFSATIDGEDTGVKTNGTSSFLKIQNKTTKFSFGFKSSVGVKPSKAKVIIYDLNGNTEWEQTVTRTNTSSLFTVSLNTAKANISAGSKMKIQGIYTDTDGDHAYPAVEVGLVFQAAFTALNVAASFKTPVSSTLKLFGDINTKFDLPLDYDLDSKANITEYTDEDTGAQIQTRQIAFGYKSEVMKELKQLQLEHRADNKGEAASGRDNVKAYLEKLMEDDDDDDKKKDDDTDKEKEKADDAQDKDSTKSDSAGDNSFNYDFSVALVLTVESGVTKKGEADGQNYFDSLVLIASGEADYSFSTVYTTPIGIDIIAEMAVSGKAVAAFGVESSNANKYDDTFNLTKNGSDKGAFKLDSDHFSLYTKFLLAPTITVGAGVGVGGGKVASVTVSGTAAFDFGFDVPIMGNNTASSGSGTVTLSADLKLKILFIKKSWNLYKSKKIDLFSYGTQSVAEMLSDFEENYLYDEISDTEVLDRDYLENRSKWQPYDISTMSIESGGETTLEEGVYPYPQTKIVDLGDGKLLMVYVDDLGETKKDGTYKRDEYNRSELMYTVSEDNGTTWSKPVSVEDDGTWDESPDAFVVKDGKVLVTWSNASRKYTADDDVATTLSLLDISAAWFDTDKMEMGEAFDITETTDEDQNSDAAPMISYDEETQRLMVYYTKVDYNEKYDREYNTDDVEGTAQDVEDVTEYGDIVNGYNVIAYRYAEWKDGEFVWNDTYSEEELENNEDLSYFYGQRFLDLAVPATITETTQTSTTTAQSINADGNLEEVTVETQKTVRDLDTSKSTTDPRIVDSDLISYNGLALYAYTMDFDQDLTTLDDQQLYVQIYNYATDQFYYPIQITSGDGGNSNPQFVRCKNMTYLYWIHDGDIQYMNITQAVRSLERSDDSSDSSNSILQLKEVTAQDGSKVNMYILDRSNTDPIMTAIKHETETDEDGNVTENAISDFDIEANDTSMYILWTAMVTSQKDENASGTDNLVRETQIFGAYCEPEITLEETEETVTFEDVDGEVKYTFADGKGNNTYPVSVTVLKDTTNEDGNTVKAGTTYTFDYETTDEDVNGEIGLVKAGDKAVRTTKEIKVTDGSAWSEPIQITTESGANYTDLSFRVTDDNEIQASYAKGTQTLNEDNCFEEDEDTKSLCVQTFKVTSEIQATDIETAEDMYYPGDTAEFSVDVTNDGLKPLYDVTYRTYVTKDGETLEGSETEWLPLAETTKLISSDTQAAGSDEEKTDSVEVELKENTVNQFLGGNTITVTGSAVLADSLDNTVLCVEIKDADGKVTKKEKTITSEENISVSVDKAELTDEKTAEITATVSNTGNKDYTGKVEVSYDGKTIQTEKDVEIPYGESVTITMETDVSSCKYGELTTNEDGSKQDAIDLEVSCDGASTSTQVVRSTTSEAGYAYDAVKSFEIGSSDATDEDSEAVKVDGSLTIQSDEVVYLESMFDIDSTSDVAKKLDEQGISADAMMTTAWESSDPSVAYINSKGVLVPMKEGEVEITATVYPKNDKNSTVEASATGSVDEYDENDFGTITSSNGTGYSINEDQMYKVPESLIRTKTIKVKIKKASDTSTSSGTTSNGTSNNGSSTTTTVTGNDNKNDTTTVTDTAVGVVVPDDKNTSDDTTGNVTDNTTGNTTDNTTGNVTDNTTVGQTPEDTDNTNSTGTATTKKKTVKKLTVSINKKRNKVTVKTIKKAKVTVEVYKTKALAKAGKKKGRIKTYTVKASKNKTGKVKIKLSKILKKNQAVRVTVQKTGYKTKRVVKK